MEKNKQNRILTLYIIYRHSYMWIELNKLMSKKPFIKYKALQKWAANNKYLFIQQPSRVSGRTEEENVLCTSFSNHWSPISRQYIQNAPDPKKIQTVLFRSTSTAPQHRSRPKPQKHQNTFPKRTPNQHEKQSFIFYTLFHILYTHIIPKQSNVQRH